MKVNSVKRSAIALVLALAVQPSFGGSSPLYLKLKESAPFDPDMKSLLDSIRANSKALDIARLDVSKGRAIGVEYESSSRFLGRILEDLLHPVMTEDFWASGLINSYFHHVFEPLPGFLPTISSHQGYFRHCGASDNITEIQGWRAYLIHRMDRSPERIGSLWQTWKGTLFAMLPPEVYVEKDFQRTVDALLESDRHIRSLRNSAARLEQSWNGVVKESSGDWSESCYGPEWANGLDSTIIISNKRGINENWVASFWMRRHHENNRDVVRSILLEIQKHYQDMGISNLVKDRDQQNPNHSRHGGD